MSTSTLDPSTPTLDPSTATLDPNSRDHGLQTQRWRVHETGRVMHLLVDGLASCGEPGTGWRTVAGMQRCTACRSSVTSAT